MISKQQYLFSKKTQEGASHGHTNATMKASPYTYDTPAQPKMSSNIKRATKTFSRGNVPSIHNHNVFSKESEKLRMKLYKEESQLRMAKNKKYNENKKKIQDQWNFSQYQFGTS